MMNEENRIYPNTFQVFNSYIDRAMEHLTDAELRVLLFATRHTMGWKDHIHSRTAHLSVTMFVDGYEYDNREGGVARFGGCGIGRNAVSKALNSLESFGLLERAGYADQKGQQWRLGESPNWEALKARTAIKDEANKQRIERAKQASQIPHTVARYDGVEAVPSDGTTPIPSHVLNQTHDQNHLKRTATPIGVGGAIKPVKVVKPRPPIERSELFKAVALGSFNIHDVSTLDGKLVTRVNILVKWLRENSPGATVVTLDEFYRWYDKIVKAPRPRDVAVFGLRFVEFKQERLAAAPQNDELARIAERNKRLAEQRRAEHDLARAGQEGNLDQAA